MFVVLLKAVLPVLCLAPSSAPTSNPSASSAANPSTSSAAPTREAPESKSTQAMKPDADADSSHKVPVVFWVTVFTVLASFTH